MSVRVWYYYFVEADAAHQSRYSRHVSRNYSTYCYPLVVWLESFSGFRAAWWLVVPFLVFAFMFFWFIIRHFISNYLSVGSERVSVDIICARRHRSRIEYKLPPPIRQSQQSNHVHDLLVKSTIKGYHPTQFKGVQGYLKRSHSMDRVGDAHTPARVRTHHR